MSSAVLQDVWTNSTGKSVVFTGTAQAHLFVKLKIER